MCKAPKPPKPKDPKKPQFLRNRYLDEFIGGRGIDSIRTGRSSLRIPMGSAAAAGGRDIGESLVDNEPAPGPRDDVMPDPSTPRGGRGRRRRNIQER
jgi:hypothetical protein